MSDYQSLLVSYEAFCQQRDEALLGVKVHETTTAIKKSKEETIQLLEVLQSNLEELSPELKGIGLIGMRNVLLRKLKHFQLGERQEVSWPNVRKAREKEVLELKERMKCLAGEVASLVRDGNNLRNRLEDDSQMPLVLRLMQGHDRT